jgi:hypothetical protein
VKKIISALAIAALGAAVITTTASARTESRFTVIGLTQSSHPTHGGVIVRDSLVLPGDRDVAIGHARIKFSPRAHHSVRARGVFTLAGGTLKVKGVFSGASGRVNVIGGTRRWNGAAGKVNLSNAGHGAERYRFTVVQ